MLSQRFQTIEEELRNKEEQLLQIQIQQRKQANHLKIFEQHLKAREMELIGRELKIAQSTPVPNKRCGKFSKVKLSVKRNEPMKISLPTDFQHKITTIRDTSYTRIDTPPGSPRISGLRIVALPPNGYKGKTWGPSTVHQRERLHLPTCLFVNNLSTNSTPIAFSKSAPSLDKKVIPAHCSHDCIAQNLGQNAVYNKGSKHNKHMSKKNHSSLSTTSLAVYHNNNNIKSDCCHMNNKKCVHIVPNLKNMTATLIEGHSDSNLIEAHLDDDEIVPTSMNCFPFLGSGAHNNSNNAKNISKLSSSVDNSPNVQRKCLHIVTNNCKQCQHSCSQFANSPPLEIDENTTMLLDEVNKDGIRIEGGQDLTYDRMFYKSMEKSIDKIFSTSKTGKTNQNSTISAHDWQNCNEHLSTRSTDNLTDLNTDARTTTTTTTTSSNYAYRFMNDTESSQFPRHCFFRQTEQTNKTNYELRQFETTVNSNTLQVTFVKEGEEQPNITSQNSSKISAVTFPLDCTITKNTSSLSLPIEEKLTIKASPLPMKSQKKTNTNNFHSLDSLTLLADDFGEQCHCIKIHTDSVLCINSAHLNISRLTNANDGEEICENHEAEQVEQKQTKLQGQQLQQKNLNKYKVLKTKTNLTNQTQMPNDSKLLSSGSTNKLKSWLNIITFGTLKISDKKCKQNSKSTYKLFENTETDFDADILAMEKQRTKSQ